MSIICRECLDPLPIDRIGTQQYCDACIRRIKQEDCDERFGPPDDDDDEEEEET